MSFDSRINVGVYNASATIATATVDISCNEEVPDPLGGVDALIASVKLTIPPNSLVQETVLQSSLAPPRPRLCSLPHHVVVTSDQAGLSYAAALSNAVTPQFPGLAPMTF